MNTVKKIRAILIAATLAFAAFSAVLYSSCQKNPTCSSVCLNGSSCANGVCRCLSGYYGSQCQYAKIIYRNNTFTTVRVIVGRASSGSSVVSNDTVMYIPPFSTVPYYGIPGTGKIPADSTAKIGDTAVATFYTFGPYGPSGGTHDVIFGETISWDTVKTGFTTNGTVFVDINVNDNFFFLQIDNQNIPPAGSLNIQNIEVNSFYLGAYDTIQFTPGHIALHYSGDFTVVNDSGIHNVGYFGSAQYSNVVTTDVSGTVVSKFAYLPFGLNQSFLMYVP